MDFSSIHRLGLRWAAIAALPLCLAACSIFQPTLVAVKVAEVPKPGGPILGSIWSQTPGIEVKMSRGEGSLRETRDVQLHAISDGRALAILAIWPDAVKSLERQAWVWDPQSEGYRLESNEVDRCALLWPLSKGADFDLQSARPASYDVWLWQAGWSDIGGYADDQKLDIKILPPDATPSQEEGLVFWSANHASKILQKWTPDEGVPGVLASERPHYHLSDRMPGAAAQDAGGSAADVRIQSLYKIDYGDQPSSWFVNGGVRTPGAWLGDPERKGYWLVVFYRTLTTGDKESDAQITGPGPHPFAVAVSDGDPWPSHFTSGAVRLKLPK